MTLDDNLFTFNEIDVTHLVDYGKRKDIIVHGKRKKLSKPLLLTQN